MAAMLPTKTLLKVIKIGGNVIDDEANLYQFLIQLSAIKTPLVLIHGGGKIASTFATKMGLHVSMVNGRRVTDFAQLQIVQAVYAGLINKNIVARLQSLQRNALGLCGPDGNLISAVKRPVVDNIDYGYVGDITSVNAGFLHLLLQQGLLPVIAPLSHDGRGQMLNTNADTIASSIAIAMSSLYEVELVLAFEQAGVLADPADAQSVIAEITFEKFQILQKNGIVSGGMLPKLENSFAALRQGVSRVHICKWDQVGASTTRAGTMLI